MVSKKGDIDIVENPIIDEKLQQKSNMYDEDEWGFYVELDIDTDVGKYMKFTNNIKQNKQINQINPNKQSQSHKKINILPTILEDAKTIIKSYISPSKIIGVLVLTVVIFSI